MFSLALGSWGIVWSGDKASADGRCTHGVLKRHSLAFTRMLHAALCTIWDGMR